MNTKLKRAAFKGQLNESLPNESTTNVQ